MNKKIIFKYFYICLSLTLILVYSASRLGYFASADKLPAPGNDHTKRWIESKYMYYGINAYDVAYGKVEPVVGIGQLANFDGYPAWAMVSGIIMNFTFLPESAASKVVWLLINLSLLFAIYLAYRHGKLNNYSRENIYLLILCVVMLSGWYTVQRWLNYGSVFGVLVCVLIMLNEEEKYPIPAGILLSWLVSKPQMLAPFIIVMMIRGKWKTLFIGGAITIVEWIFACIHTNTSPLRFLSQLGTTGGTENIIAMTFKMMSVDISRNFALVLGAIFGIGVLVLLSVNLPKKCDKWLAYSVPAIISQFWSYNQAHDSTVYIIFLFAVFDFLKREQAQEYFSTFSKVACFGIISVTKRSDVFANPIANIFELNPGGTSRFISMSYYYIQILVLIMLVFATKFFTNEEYERLQNETEVSDA